MAKATRIEPRDAWYETLMSDVRKMAFAGIVATKHAIGKRILADEFRLGRAEYGARTLNTLARDLGMSRTDLYDCVRFATLYPELSDVSDNLSWYAITHKLLPAPNRSAPSVPSTDCCSVEDLYTLVKQGKTFKTFYADPPWPYGNQATRASTDKHYRTMDLESIAALPVAQLAKGGAHLHLWTTNGFLFQAKAIIEAWGFEYKSCFVWVKPQMGIGNYWRVSHEFLLFGLRGQCKFTDRGQMSWLLEDRTKHSEKPHKIRQLVERVSPAPRLELFGRAKSVGWTVWGDEIQRHELFED